MSKKAKKNKILADRPNEDIVYGNQSNNVSISIVAKNQGQKLALKAISENKITFIYGSPRYW